MADENLEYPRTFYHPNGTVQTVNNAQEEASLGPDWHDSPAKYGVETCPGAPVITEGGFAMQGYAAPSYPPPPASDPVGYEPGTIPEEAQASMQALEAEAEKVRGGKK